jgi:anti-anti-sigma factor
MRLADLQVVDEGRVVIARLSGELDLSNTANIGGALTESVPNDAFALIMDLTEVEYLDSGGIHLIYELRERLRARDQVLQLVIPIDSPAHDALRLAGVAAYVPTTDTLDAALAAVG